MASIPLRLVLPYLLPQWGPLSSGQVPPESDGGQEAVGQCLGPPILQGVELQRGRV